MNRHQHESDHERGPGTPDEWAAYLTQATPEAATASMLQLLDAEKLSYSGRIDALKALERHMAWMQGLQARLLAALDADTDGNQNPEAGREWWAHDFDFVVDEVACALKLSSISAGDRLRVARELDARLPTTLGLLETGEVSWMQAKAMVEITDVLDPGTVQQVEAAVAPSMPSMACGQTRRALHRAVARVDPDGAQLRHQARKRERKITHREADDGMALWGAFLPAEQAARLDAAVDAHAATLTDREGAERTLAQRRVDALVDLVVNQPGSSVTSGGRSGQSAGGRSAAVVQVTVPLDALLGTEETPAELKGYGLVTAAQARQIAFSEDVVWRRLLTEPETGMVVKTDPTTYKPTAETARHVIARDRVCAFPSCQMPAHRCDLDHIHPYDHDRPEVGGQSVPENLIPLCRRHHLLKHRTDWNVQRDEESGEVTWTAPSGHTYTTRPHDYRQ